MTKLAINIQKIHSPPMLTFDEDFGGRKISWLFLAFRRLIVGMLASIMGVGGGDITLPMFVYIFGVSTTTTVGTDILQIILTAGLASIAQYAIYGYVFYTLAMGMLIGSLIGIQVGVLTTKVVKGIHIRGFNTVSIIAGFINRATTLPKNDGGGIPPSVKIDLYAHRDDRQLRLLDRHHILRILGLEQVLRKYPHFERGGVRDGTGKETYGTRNRARCFLFRDPVPDGFADFPEDSRRGTAERTPVG